MRTRSKYRSQILYFIVGVVSFLLLANVVLIYSNSLRIERAKQIQEAAERAKVNTLDIIRDLHLLDIGVRGYGLVRNPAFLSSVDSARDNRERIFSNLARALAEQNYPHLDELDRLHREVKAYFTLADSMLNLIRSGQQQAFVNLLNEDRGYAIWLTYRSFSQDVNQFENRIVAEAKTSYERALRNSYLLQTVLFLLCVPSLLYMAFYSSRTFSFMDALARSEQERNEILEKQNQVLDEQVRIKTQDILLQNEEITAQNEEIKAHNDQMLLQQLQLQNANETIEEQSRLIAEKNEELKQEVLRQTSDLRETNHELLEQNSRFQQFAYIISHNLRAPLARLKGLANILDSARDKEEKERIYQLMIKSSHELDDVITDLSTILNIQKLTTLVRTEVNLEQVVNKVLSTLEEEVKHVSATVNVRMDEAMILSLAPYVESIFYNLISNAIKYRDPGRNLLLNITAQRQDHSLVVSVEDNGLGIDLTKYWDNLFNLYKRFHHHVEGKGLGLYLVKTQVEALGGKIEVESEVNRGTKFKVHFRN